MGIVCGVAQVRLWTARAMRKSRDAVAKVKKLGPNRAASVTCLPRKVRGTSTNILHQHAADDHALGIAVVDFDTRIA